MLTLVISEQEDPQRHEDTREVYKGLARHRVDRHDCGEKARALRLPPERRLGDDNGLFINNASVRLRGSVAAKVIDSIGVDANVLLLLDVALVLLVLGEMFQANEGINVEGLVQSSPQGVLLVYLLSYVSCRDPRIGVVGFGAGPVEVMAASRRLGGQMPTLEKACRFLEFEFVVVELAGGLAVGCWQGDVRSWPVIPRAGERHKAWGGWGEMMERVGVYLKKSDPTNLLIKKASVGKKKL